jgi:hypothetical protein
MVPVTDTSKEPMNASPSASSATASPAGQLYGLVESSDDPDLDSPSITDVNGTVARFNMVVSEASQKTVSFGPPLQRMLPALFFVAFAACLLAVVGVAYASGSNSSLRIWVVEGDAGRPLPAWALATFVAISALATVARTRMIGIVVMPDGIETRDLMMFGIPRIKRWSWPQIDRFVFDASGTMLEMWNNSYERLPKVAKTKELHELLMNIAVQRNKIVTKLERKGE